MVGWHNAVATRLGEALAETEKHRNTLIHRFLSPRFTGLKIILISSRGVRLRQAYAETGRSLLFACPCLSSFAPEGGFGFLPSVGVDDKLKIGEVLRAIRRGGIMQTTVQPHSGRTVGRGENKLNLHLCGH